MPLMLLVFAGGSAIGGLGGFIAGDGISGASRLLKWGIIGTCLFFAGKRLKWI